MLAHRRSGDADRRRHAGHEQPNQQDGERDVHRFSNDTWVTRRCSTRSTTTRYPSSVSSSPGRGTRSEEHTSELQSPCNLVCRLLLEKKNKRMTTSLITHH